MKDRGILFNFKMKFNNTKWMKIKNNKMKHTKGILHRITGHMELNKNILKKIKG